MDWNEILKNPAMIQYVIGPLLALVLGFLANYLHKKTGIEVNKVQQEQVATFFKSMILQADEYGETQKKKEIPFPGIAKKEYAIDLAANEIKEALPWIKKPTCQWLTKKVNEAVALEPTVGSTAIKIEDLKGYKIVPGIPVIPGQTL
jgi:hypothetical protein